MEMTAGLSTSLSWLVGGVLLIIFAYVFVRAASHAFFRTKLEYLRSALREMKKERDHHG